MSDAISRESNSALNRDEFYDVYRSFRPDATREEYAHEWELFQQAKALHLAKRAIQ